MRRLAVRFWRFHLKFQRRRLFGCMGTTCLLEWWLLFFVSCTWGHTATLLKDRFTYPYPSLLDVRFWGHFWDEDPCVWKTWDEPIDATGLLMHTRSLSATICHWWFWALLLCGSAGMASTQALPWPWNLELMVPWLLRWQWTPPWLQQQVASPSSCSDTSSQRSMMWERYAMESWPAWCPSLQAVATWKVAVLLPLVWLAVLFIRLDPCCCKSSRLMTLWMPAQCTASAVPGGSSLQVCLIGAGALTITMVGVASVAWRMMMDPARPASVAVLLQSNLSWSWWSSFGLVASLHWLSPS